LSGKVCICIQLIAAVQCFDLKTQHSLGNSLISLLSSQWCIQLVDWVSENNKWASELGWFFSNMSTMASLLGSTAGMVSRSCRIFASERGGYSVFLVADKVHELVLVIGGGAKGSADEQQVMAMVLNSATALDRLSDSIIDCLDLLITVFPILYSITPTLAHRQALFFLLVTLSLTSWMQLFSTQTCYILINL
jgi:hypothetical protein